jgi:hypothetical protein
MIIMGLALGGVQLFVILLAWISSPYWMLTWIECLSWLLAMALLIRSRHWIGGLQGKWKRMTALLVWQFPGLFAGGCSLCIFTKIWHLPSIAVFLLQAWLQPLSPIFTILPRSNINDVAFYLWATASLPFFLFIGSTIIMASTPDRSIPLSHDRISN